ncbi:MAG: IS3 family transposase [Thiotrichaceae bacterium]|nr:IS3 family transposase [Thiotrichaceae bacterium]MBL1260532.1 IS3 family transposase [Thiotrichaceae bacterium]
MKYAWIASNLDIFDLQPMCRVLSVKKSSYFSWTQIDHLQKEKSAHEDYQLIEKAFFDLKENAGTRGIKGHLLHKNDEQISRRKIGKILATLGLEVKTQKKFKKQSTAAVNDPRIMPNILNRHFEVSYPNQVWVGDITEIKTRQGKLYLAVYVDLYSRRVVGFATAPHMRSELTELALQRALWSRKPPRGLMVHTDQGSQFISNDYRKLLAAWGLKQSMSRRGNCWDNAVIESFFKTLKVETIYQHSRLIEMLEMKWLVDGFIGHYNHDRPHSFNKYLSPVKFEQVRIDQVKEIEKNLGTK